MAAVPRVIIDYGKPYDGDFEFRPDPLTPKHFTCVGGEDCDGSLFRTCYVQDLRRVLLCMCSVLRTCIGSWQADSAD